MSLRDLGVGDTVLVVDRQRQNGYAQPVSEVRRIVGFRGGVKRICVPEVKRKASEP